MKGRMERLVVFPFTAGCVSSSSVSICIQHGRRPKEDIISSHMVCRSKEGPKDHNDTSSDYMMKGSSRLPTLSKPNIYIGFHRLTRSIKSLSQSLDVKHVTHIGFDGSTTHNANGCNDNLDVSDLLSLCPDFVAQYEQRATFVPIDASCGMQDKS
ncbi:hypothetical protein Ccrd_014120, partial [Cynara cardunculus var. scolymus]